MAPILLCPKHGKSSVVFGCEHFREDVDNRQLKQYLSVRMPNPHKFCGECAEKYEIEKLPDLSMDWFLNSDSELTDEDFEKELDAYDKLHESVLDKLPKVYAICYTCIKEASTL